MYVKNSYHSTLYIEIVYNNFRKRLKVLSDTLQSKLGMMKLCIV
jgi:hypothetical protein